MQSSPSEFQNPYTWPSKIARIIWTAIYWAFYRWTPPRRGMFIRLWILRVFGAQIGQSWIHPSTRVWAPWLLVVGDDCFVDARCNIYNSFGVSLGDRTIVSFGTTLCSVSHDYEDPAYRLTGGRIEIGSDCWVTAECFVCPGVKIGDGAVCGARSVVTKPVPAWSVAAGNPARVIRQRRLNSESENSDAE